MVKSIDESEQWKLDGLCSKCRRNSYCGDTCRAARSANKRMVAEVAGSIFRRSMRMMAEKCSEKPEEDDKQNE